jgi:hypothetical protein
MSIPKRYNPAPGTLLGMEQSDDGCYVLWSEYCETVRKLVEGEPVAVPHRKWRTCPTCRDPSEQPCATCGNEGSVRTNDEL